MGTAAGQTLFVCLEYSVYTSVENN